MTGSRSALITPQRRNLIFVAILLGMLLAALDQTIVGRTGRYKIFPVAGTALMALAFLLMSRMDPSTSALLQSAYLIILGAGSGCPCRC